MYIVCSILSNAIYEGQIIERCYDSNEIAAESDNKNHLIRECSSTALDFVTPIFAAE